MMFSGIFNRFKKNEEPPLAPQELQDCVNEFPCQDIHEATQLAEQLRYSIVVTIRGHHGEPDQRWRVYPDGQSPRLVHRQRGH